MRHSSLLLPLGLLAFEHGVLATRMRMSGRTELPDLQRRTAMSGQASVGDSNNVQYTINVTLGGQPLQIMIDTGR